MNLFSKKRKTPGERYKIAFCDTPDLSSKFGEYKAIFDCYSTADHYIRMGWKRAIKGKTENAYQIEDAWLVIEKVLDTL